MSGSAADATTQFECKIPVLQIKRSDRYVGMLHAHVQCRVEAGPSQRNVAVRAESSSSRTSPSMMGMEWLASRVGDTVHQKPDEVNEMNADKQGLTYYLGGRFNTVLFPASLDCEHRGSQLPCSDPPSSGLVSSTTRWELSEGARSYASTSFPCPRVVEVSVCLIWKL